MRFLNKMTIIVVTAMLAAGGLFAGGLPARAESNTYERLQNRLIARRTGIDVRIIQQRQNRRIFQVQQQWNREQERRNAMQPMDLRVPTMKPTCQLPINGNAYAGARCR